MASRLASEGMTWSTRTGRECTGARSGPPARRRLGHISHTRHAPLNLPHRARTLVAGLALAAAAAPGLAIANPAGAADLLTPKGPDVPAVAPTTRAGDLPGDSTNVRIALTENNGNDTIVYSPGGVSAPGVANAPAVRFQQAGGAWNVETALDCAGDEPGGAAPWSSLVATGQSTPTASPLDASQPLQLCVGGGNTVVHGTLQALYNSSGQARTVNTLPLEVYVADTVPGESPSSWAGLGGPGPQGQNWGFQALEAQAVAVRSFVLANPNGYGGYADTCDQTCQDYQGINFESAASIASANDTAGQVMEFPNGQIATTEYSSSDGGYTSSSAQGSPFTPVPDAGDAICLPSIYLCNSNHDWTAFVSGSTIQQTWPQVGTFAGITILTQDGFNDPGESYSRVNTLSVNGSAGSVTMSGSQFANAVGLNSDFFNVDGYQFGGAALEGHGWGHGIGMGQFGAMGYAMGQDGGLGNWTYQQILGHFYQPATLSTLPGASASAGSAGGVGGYWLGAADGGIFSFGNAVYQGSMGGHPLNQPIVGLAGTADNAGYWEVASDGGIFSFGDAQFFGSMGGRPLNRPVVGMAPTRDGGGYWEVASDGGIFAFGDAQFVGSMGGRPLNRPMVGMAPTPDGGGYWLVASDGGIFAFGDAQFFGSTGSLALVRPVVGMASASDGAGYWLVAADGGVFTFGDAAFKGSAAGSPGGAGATAIAPTRTGGGYLVVNGAGQVSSFGDAPGLGDLTTAVPGYGGHVVGLVTTAG